MADKVEMVTRNRERFGLNRCCEAVGLSKSSWYSATRLQTPSQDDVRLKEEIVAIIEEHPGYGRRRITRELKERLNEPINEKRVRRLLKAYDLALKRCLPKHRPSPIQQVLKEHHRKIDFVTGRSFDVLQAFSTDFTEIPYAQGSRKAYLMAFVDIVSKWVPGWAVGKSNNTELALKAWETARAELSSVRGSLQGVIVHHDRDSVYTGYDWLRRLLLMDGVRVSYSLNGAKNNSWIESFWSRLKVENSTLFWEAETLEDLIEVVNDRLMYYNERRRHSQLQYEPPIVALEKLMKDEESPSESSQ